MTTKQDNHAQAAAINHALQVAEALFKEAFAVPAYLPANDGARLVGFSSINGTYMFVYTTTDDLPREIFGAPLLVKAFLGSVLDRLWTACETAQKQTAFKLENAAQNALDFAKKRQPKKDADSSPDLSASSSLAWEDLELGAWPGGQLIVVSRGEGLGTGLGAAPGQRPW